MRGTLDVDSLLASTPGPLLTEWMGYHKAHASDTDVLLARLCALVANALRSKGEPTIQPWDFLPKLRPPRRADAPDRVAAAMKAWGMGMMGAPEPR